MAEFVSRTPSKESRRMGRDGQALPYSRQSGHKKSSWGISGLWNWLSRPLGDSSGQDNAYESSSSEEPAQTPEPYTASRAAQTLTKRGQEIQDSLVARVGHAAEVSSNSPGGPPQNTVSSGSGSSKPKPLQPRSNFPTSQSMVDINQTRQWLAAKVARGEAIQAEDAAGLLGLLDNVQSANNSPSFRTKLAHPKYTLASSRSSPNFIASNSPQRTLNHNPNGELFYRGIAVASRSSSRNSSPRASRPESPNIFSSSSEGKRRKMDARNSLWSQPSPNNSPISASTSAPANGFNSKTSTNAGLSAGAGTGSSFTTPTATNGQKRSKYAAYVEDAPEEGDSPHFIPASTKTAPKPTVSNTTSSAASNGNSIFANKSSATAAGSLNSQLRNSAYAAPRKPSPLRQSVQPTTPSPPRRASGGSKADGGSSPTPVSTPSAYKIMSDIIKDATDSTPPPAKSRSIFTNPYQGSGHVRKVVPRKVSAPKMEEVPKKAPVPKAEEKQKVKGTGNGFLDFLEASAPLSAKRGREEDEGEQEELEISPPSPRKTKFDPQAQAPVAKASAFAPKKAAPPAPKKAAPAPKKAAPPVMQEVIEIDELDEDDEPVMYDKTTVARPSEIVEPDNEKPKQSTANKGGFTTPSAPAPKSAMPVAKPAFFPKEPSPLRQSFQPSPEAPKPNLTGHTAAPAPAPAPATAQPSLNKKRTRAEIAALPIDQLPVFKFDMIPTRVYNERAKAAALAVPLDKLPKFDFSSPISVHISGNTTMSNSEPTAAKAPPPMPTGGFNWAAAGVKPPTAAPGVWTCEVCMVQNPAVKSKCQACDSPAPAKAALDGASVTAVNGSSPMAAGFDWAAAGVKPPTVSSAVWTCEVCMVQNPLTKTKCQACESPAPASTASAASSDASSVTAVPSMPSSSGFKMPSFASFGQAATASTTAAPSMPSSSGFTMPSSTGFNWAAAGMKPPTTSSAIWTCAVCMVQNPATKTKCQACEAPPP